MFPAISIPKQNYTPVRITPPKQPYQPEPTIQLDLDTLTDSTKLKVMKLMKRSANNKPRFNKIRQISKTPQIKPISFSPDYTQQPQKQKILQEQYPSKDISDSKIVLQPIQKTEVHNEKHKLASADNSVLGKEEAIINPPKILQIDIPQFHKIQHSYTPQKSPIKNPFSKGRYINSEKFAYRNVKTAKEINISLQNARQYGQLEYYTPMDTLPQFTSQEIPLPKRETYHETSQQMADSARYLFDGKREPYRRAVECNMYSYLRRINKERMPLRKLIP